MGKRTSYAPGTFSWVDLATPDPAAAKEFYGGLFGWQADDQPAGAGMTYSMLLVDGDAVAALYELAGDRRAQEPPHWTSYVTVQDTNATAARAGELGGSVLGEPFDVLSVGRMTVLGDPGGAVLAAWQPREHIGAARVNEPGCLCWNELATRDPEAAASFYGGLFEWSFEPIDTGPGGPQLSVIRRADGSRNGDIRVMTDAEESVRSHWMPYFGARSCADAVVRARELGAEVLMQPTEVPAGHLAAVRDPQGAAFGLVDGEMDP